MCCPLNSIPPSTLNFFQVLFFLVLEYVCTLKIFSTAEINFMDILFCGLYYYDSAVYGLEEYFSFPVYLVQYSHQILSLALLALHSNPGHSLALFQLGHWKCLCIFYILRIRKTVSQSEGSVSREMVLARL